MQESGRRVAKAATVVMALFVVSRVLGLVQRMVAGAMFGASGELDAYLTAIRIPDMIFMVVAGGALGSAFIPTFSGYLTQDDREGAWRLASSIVNLIVLVLSGIGLLIALFAPFFVRTLIAPGFDPAQQALTVRLLRVTLISSVIFGVSGIAMGALNAHQHFLFPALASSVYNLSIIGGALFLGPRMGVMGMAVGVVIGAVLHLLVQVPTLVRRGMRYVFTLGLDSPGVREVGRLMAPRVLGTAITQINFVINNSLASTMGEGAVSMLTYAWLLMLLPQGVFAQAVGTAVFPTFASQAARNERDEMRRTLAGTLRAIFLLCLPAMVGLWALAYPLVELLFERGAFEATSTVGVVWALRFYVIGLVGHAGLEIVARAFYALHDTRTPVWVGAGAMALNVILSFSLPFVFEGIGWPPHAGLAFANSIATLLEFGLLFVLIRGRMDGLEGRRTLLAVGKSALAAAAMGLVLLGWRSWVAGAAAWLVGGGGVLLGGVAYLVGTLLLQADELLQLVRR